MTLLDPIHQQLRAQAAEGVADFYETATQAAQNPTVIRDVKREVETFALHYMRPRPHQSPESHHAQILGVYDALHWLGYVDRPAALPAPRNPS